MEGIVIGVEEILIVAFDSLRLVDIVGVVMFVGVVIEDVKLVRDEVDVELLELVVVFLDWVFGEFVENSWIL